MLRERDLGVTLKGQHERSPVKGILYVLTVVNILVMILYYSFAGCYHWGKIGKGK